MHKVRLFILLSIYMVFSFVLNNKLIAEEQKTGTISGNIVSSMTNQPLIGVAVRIIDSQLGTYSKEDGKFSIKNVPAGRISVQFRYVGYQKLVKSDIQIVPNKTQNITVSMTEAFTETEEITVKGSYFTKIADAATGTQSFSSEDIKGMHREFKKMPLELYNCYPVLIPLLVVVMI